MADITKINLKGTELNIKDAGAARASDVATALAAKQATLVSGTNIKTINNESLLGSGNLTIQGNKGDKGDKGDTVVVDTSGLEQFDIINDLTSGGASYALSAEMGKRLTSLIIELSTLVNNALEKVAWIDDDGGDAMDDIQDFVDELTKPVIYLDTSSLSFSTTTGTQVTKTFKAHGGNLSSDISLSVTGTGFSIDKNSIGKNDGETTVTVTYNPSSSGSHTGTVTLSSTGATSVTVNLTGSAAAQPAIVVSPSSLSLSANEGGTATATFSVSGVSLTDDITLALTSGSVFSINKNSIDNDANNETVTVTYSPSSAGTDTDTITLSSTGVTSETISLSGTCTAIVLSASFSTTKQIYTSDTLDWLKQFVTVQYGGETVASADYTLSGTLQVGTSTLTVTYDSKTTTFTISNVLAGVASFYDFLNKHSWTYQFQGNEPYATANNKRSVYWKMDKQMDGGKTYTFIADVNYNTAQFGFIFYNQQILDSYNNHQNVSSQSSKIWDSTWQDQGVNAQFTPAASVNGYPIVGCRVTSRVNSSDSVIPDDYLVERVVLIEVVS